MKKLVFVVGSYFLAKAGVDTFHVVERFSSYTFDTAYAAGFAMGQIAAPVLFLVVGVLLIRHSWSTRPSTAKQVPTI